MKKLLILLLGVGLAINAELSPLDEALLVAVRGERLNEAAELIIAGANVNLSFMETPVIFLASSPEMLRLLIENGANPNAIGPDGGSLMHHYVKSSLDKFVQDLFDIAGSDLDLTITDGSGKTALDLAERLVFSYDPDVSYYFALATRDLLRSLTATS